MFKITKYTALDVRPHGDKEYNIISINLANNNETILLTGKQPITNATKSNWGKKLINTIENKVADNVVREWAESGEVDAYGLTAAQLKDEYINTILSYLENVRIKFDDDEFNEDAFYSELRQKIIEKKHMNNKYPKLYQSFKKRCIELNMTPFEFIVKITNGVGVGASVEIVRAFLGLLQTILGKKGTNTIAVGQASGGKSFIIESALRFVPDEYVIKGVKTPAYFFRKYNGQDLTGKLFYLGDLGGTKDDEDTIRMRDMLKQLTTDGYIERGVVDVDDKSADEQKVTGYPALIYTTAHSSIINEQEKTRSIVLTPPMIEGREISLFKDIQKNKGKFKNELDKVDTDIESVKGLVYYLKTNKCNNNALELFNAYKYCVTDYLSNMHDLNRKIDEFDSVLYLICLLDKAEVLWHREYDTETPLMIASKQDVYTALTLFDNVSDLLPNEKNTLNDIYSNMDYLHLNYISNDYTLDEYAKMLREEVLDENGILDWTSVNSKTEHRIFNAEYLRKTLRGEKWVQIANEELDYLLKKYESLGYLINIGDTKLKLYCLNELDYPNHQLNMVNIEMNNEKIKEYCSLLKYWYPSIENDIEDIVELDEKNIKDKLNKLITNNKIYKLPY